jgi:predicted nuclease of restriction endonuclease-like (RecB) superfamily
LAHRQRDHRSSEPARLGHEDDFAIVQQLAGQIDAVSKRSIEKAVITHLRDFLIELGVGFAYVGSQYMLDIEGDESLQIQ